MARTAAANMVVNLCPECFTRLDGTPPRCPACAADLAETGPYDYEQGLIRALRHPFHDQRVLAARILGKRRSRVAVPSLVAVVEDGGRDPYLVAEAVRALARIGDDRGMEVVRRVAADGPAVARAVAREVLAEGWDPSARQ